MTLRKKYSWALPRVRRVTTILALMVLMATAWSWLRYSYAWQITPESFPHSIDPLKGTFKIIGRNSYVRLQAHPIEAYWLNGFEIPGFVAYPDTPITISEPVGQGLLLVDMKGPERGHYEAIYALVTSQDYSGPKTVFSGGARRMVVKESWIGETGRPMTVYSGRLHYLTVGTSWNDSPYSAIVVDTRASRFTQVSTAGVILGAFAFLILGLNIYVLKKESIANKALELTAKRRNSA